MHSGLQARIRELQAALAVSQGSVRSRHVGLHGSVLKLPVTVTRGLSW